MKSPARFVCLILGVLSLFCGSLLAIAPSQAVGQTAADVGAEPQAGSGPAAASLAGREMAGREKDAFSVRPAERLAERVLGRKHAKRIVFTAAGPARTKAGETAAATEETFEISRRGSRPMITGTSLSALLMGFNVYLGDVAGVDVSWNGDSLARLPRKLPVPTRPITREAGVTHRFGLNDTDDGYTGAYRTWKEWEHEIDVLAMKGLNELFMPVGSEAVYLEMFTEFGYTEDEMLAWIPQPAHQPWWLLQNLCCYPSKLTRHVVDQRVELGRKIADRMRELGITPVLPGYFGTVPRGFETKNPGAHVIAQGDWFNSFERPDWIDPTTPLFNELAESFYRHSEEMFGASTMYKMDILHEGGTAGNVDVRQASKAIETALRTAHPGAYWAILGWTGTPKKATLEAVDRSKMVVMDGHSDRYSDLDRDAEWLGTPYAFGTIWNFGGHTTMGANITKWNDRFWATRSKEGTALDGIALIPEASDQNPVAFDFFTRMAWASGPEEMPRWYADWAERRYGGADAAAAKAWQALGATAYDDLGDGWSEAHDSIFAAQPSLGIRTADIWSPTQLSYDGAAFAQALPALLDVKRSLRDTPAYRYDLTDVARQVLSNRGRNLLPRIQAAYEAKDTAAFDGLTTQWFEAMDLLEKVTATNAQTMLGPRLAEARSWAQTDEQADQLEYDARSLISIWGHRRASNTLRDYANREWSGLISTYYKQRWTTYFTELRAALDENRQPRAIDWYEIGDAWSRRTGDLPTKPAGDIHAIAGEVVEHLRARPTPPELSTTSSTGVLTADEPVTVTVTVRNTSEFTPITGVEVDLGDAPGVTVTASGATSTDALAPGEEFTAEFTVALAGAGATSVTTLTANASFTQGGEAAELARGVVLLAGPGTWLSDRDWTSATNGWGPVEKDRANGEQGAGDGPRLSVDGTRFDKGLGVHANSRVSYQLPGNCTRFSSVVGIDDSRGGAGSVVFSVEVDGKEAARSPLLTGSSAAYVIDVDLTGASRLDLVVNNGGDGTSDHGDWAGARLLCADAPAPQPPAAGTHFLSDLPFVDSRGDWGPWERDTHNGETAPGDGGPIVLAGTTYAKGLGTNSNAQASFHLGGKCTRFTSLIGIDDTMDKPDADGDVQAQVWADDAMVWESGTVIEAGQAPRQIDVDVAGATTLRLVVDQADVNTWWDRTDWAEAKVVCG